MSFWYLAGWSLNTYYLGLIVMQHRGPWIPCFSCRKLAPKTLVCLFVYYAAGGLRIPETISLFVCYTLQGFLNTHLFFMQQADHWILYYVFSFVRTRLVPEYLGLFKLVVQQTFSWIPWYIYRFVIKQAAPPPPPASWQTWDYWWVCPRLPRTRGTPTWAWTGMQAMSGTRSIQLYLDNNLKHYTDKLKVTRTCW